MTTTGQSLLDQAYSEVTGLQAAMQTSLADLTTAANLPYLSWFDFAGIPGISLDAPRSVALGVIAPMGATDVTLTAPGARNKITPADLPQFQQQAKADAVNFRYTPVLFDSLQGLVTSILSSGGQNVTPAIQDAVFNTGHERDLQTYRDAMDLTGAKTGAKGCRYANSMTKAAQAQVTTAYMNQKHDMSRELARTMGDLVQKNLQMAMSAGVSIEDALSNIAVKTYTVLLDAQRLVIEQYKTDTDAAIAVFDGQVKALITELDVEKLDISLESEYYSALRDQARLENTVNATEFDASLKTAIAHLDADKTVQQLNTEYQAQRINLFTASSNNIIKEGEALIAQSEEANKLKMEAIKALAESFIGIARAISVQGVSIVSHKI